MKKLFTDKRIELKYVLNHEEFTDVFFKWRFLHRPELRKIYHKRKVQNIYFDTSAHSAYSENLLGHAHKLKVRARWYDGNMAESHLEIKRKIDDVTFKDVYDVQQLEELSKGPVVLNHEHFHPALYNEYEREYFSFYGKIRVTIDKNIRYTSQVNKLSLASLLKEEPFYVLEIKYSHDVEQSILDQFFKGFPFIRSQFSKYYRGYCNAYN